MAEAEDRLKEQYVDSLQPHQRRFFIDAGDAWISDKHNTFFIKGRPQRKLLLPGDIVLRHPQVFHGGPVGWWDSMGWDEVEITTDMVGQKVAIFAGDELKTLNDRLRPEQRRLGESLASHGGRWTVIRSTPSVGSC